jgi:hypothetical protein
MKIQVQMLDHSNTRFSNHGRFQEISRFSNDSHI